MAKATCRCGHGLTLPEDGSDRVVCPRCGARVRVRRPPGSGSGSVVGDGYLRFLCPCGRRLKVRSDAPPSHGKCPDCGRVVPVPSSPSVVRPGAGVGVGVERETSELSPEQRAALEQWSSRFGGAAPSLSPSSYSEDTPISVAPPHAASDARAEAGLRVCPNCRRPIHLGADVCVSCGTPVPRRG